MERFRQIGDKARMFGLIDCVGEGTWRRERKGYMKKSHLKAREDRQVRCFGIVELTCLCTVHTRRSWFWRSKSRPDWGGWHMDSS